MKRSKGASSLEFETVLRVIKGFDKNELEDIKDAIVTLQKQRDDKKKKLKDEYTKKLLDKYVLCHIPIAPFAIDFVYSGKKEVIYMRVFFDDFSILWTKDTITIEYSNISAIYENTPEFTHVETRSFYFDVFDPKIETLKKYINYGRFFTHQLQD